MSEIARLGFHSRKLEDCERVGDNFSRDLAIHPWSTLMDLEVQYRCDGGF